MDRMVLGVGGQGQFRLIAGQGAVGAGCDFDGLMA
ncbi:hypothetical protein HD597_000426 [Nonomuraea thailandensis]|uniref:Uncharacterized protein n=1 Tax=Nonomuraea thailandensis TaxID=1188745 RepID=A0A9X2G6X0_9ACTN|nr:hypothetical protein [Nonomuraea thailandensis]